MKIKFKSDKELLNAIKEGAKKRNDALAYIYKDYNLNKRIANHLIHTCGNSKSKHDVLHEALIIFDRNVRNNRFKGESNVFTYVFSIAKRHWGNNLRQRNNNNVPLDEELLNIEDDLNPELILLKDELKLELKSLLELMGDKCKKILKFWSSSFSYAEIASKMNYSQESSARKKKYNCQKKLAKMLFENPGMIPQYYYE